MANNTFPEDWREQPCFLVAVPRPLAPYVGGLMRIAEYRGFWSSDDDYYRGYTAVIEFEGCLMATCLQDFIRLQESQYRMLDLALFGKEYSVVDEETGNVTPGIPLVHEAIFNADFGVLAGVDRLTQLVDNTVNGTATALYSYDPSVKALLQSIIDALGAEDTDIGEVITKLEVIAALVA